MKAIALFVLFASTLATAANIQQVECSSLGVSVNVDVDVLESNPPQSSISIKFRDGSTDGFSAFTEIRSLETNPSQWLYSWESHDGEKSFSVRSIDNKSGTGNLTLNSKTYKLTCRLQ